MIILGIETSCDETAVCLLEAKKNEFKILSNLVSSQVNIHKKYGGIVPEVAARKHIETILPLLNQCLEALSKNSTPDYIAVTNGPGLITSLLIGLETAKTLSYVWQKPLVGVNHLEGHLYSFLLSQKTEISNLFPSLGLVVSGGHTELVLMKNHCQYKKIGQTLDDAAGECFDKTAKLLKIGYPGGPIISRYAEKGNPYKYDLPRPMINSDNYNFSFSGLKTAVLYQSKKIKPKKILPDFCASFQQAVIDVLVAKTIKAAKEHKVKNIILGGGVIANKELRGQLAEKTKQKLPEINLFIPELKFCTDNAAMIAIAAYLHIAKKDFIPWQKIKVDPNLEL